MAEYCATHADAAAMGSCATCGRPFCGACRIENIPTEQSFCSVACRDSPTSASPNTGRPNAELIAKLRQPIRAGWQLWLSQLGRLNLWVSLPVGIALSLADALSIAAGVREERNFDLAFFAFVALTFLLAAPAVAVVLSQEYTRVTPSNPWSHVVVRFLPWLIAWVLFGVSTLLGTLLLIIPGIIASTRLFWADEFALIHGHGPLAALRESYDLTRGLGGRVFGFQFALGFAENLIFVPIVLGIGGLEALTGTLLPDFVGIGFGNLLLAALLVNGYASAHAPEVVYFYGLRAVRAQLSPDEIHGDWVEHHLRGLSSDGTPAHHTCSTCGTRWDPADYRPDADELHCSSCGAKLARPTQDESDTIQTSDAARRSARRQRRSR